MTSSLTPRTASWPWRARQARPGPRRALSSSMSASTTQAPSRRKRSAVALPMPPAPPVISATLPASGSAASACAAAWLLRAASIRCRRPPARAGRHRSRHRRGAAHDVDGVDVELAGDARRRLVPGEGDHADAGHEIDDRRWGRAWPGCRHACSARSRRRSPRDIPRSRRPGRPASCRRRDWPDRSRRPAAGSSCAGNGRGSWCRAAASGSSSFEPTNSSTAGWSSKWPTLRSPVPIMPRIAGISRAAMARRSAAGSVLRHLAAEGRLALVSLSNHSMARLMIADRRLVALLGRVAPGEQAVAFEHDAVRLRVVAAQNVSSHRPSSKPGPLPRQPADLAAEDLLPSAPCCSSQAAIAMIASGCMWSTCFVGTKACSGVSIEAARAFRLKVQCGR